MLAVFLLICCFYKTVSGFGDYHVKVTNNGPVVLGASITFTAEVFKDHIRQQGTYKFEWQDNMQPPNHFSDTHIGSSKWTINHSPKNYTFGTYEVQVAVCTNTPFRWVLCYGAVSFTLENHLVGGLALQENNINVEKYVSTEHHVNHIVKLHSPDMEYLRSNANNYDIQWLIDGNPTISFQNLSGLTWSHQYKTADEWHTITATIKAVRKIPKSLESSTEVDLVDSTNSPVDSKFNNATDPSLKEKLSYSTSDINGTITCPQKTQVCGSFSRNITVKAPIKNVNIAGSNWLQHGDMLSLQITCNGSGPFTFCKRFFADSYIVKGNETCRYPPEVNGQCDFTVDHYFRDSNLYTVLVIVANDVSKNITAYGVNIYEVTKHPQLSVIVVPLTASILAIILIIFGVAFYFQNRSSYAIEVADFDFTNNNDLEYKTFKERLAEAIHNAFNKPEEFSEEDSYNGAPSTSNKKYGSMQ